MGMLLWYGDGDDDAIGVGSVLRVFPAFAEVSRAIGGSPGYEELESVPGFAEQRVTPWWLAQVREQAIRFLREHGAGVGASARDVVARLAARIGELAVAAAELDAMKRRPGRPGGGMVG